MANSFHLNAVDFSGADYKVIVVKASFVTAASPLISGFNVSGAHGGKFQKIHYQPKTIKIECVLQGASATDRDDKLHNLLAKLNQTEEKALIIDKYTAQESGSTVNPYWNAVISAIGDRKAIGSTAYSFSLEFIAYDPFAYSPTEIDAQSNIVSSPETFIVDPGGTAEVRPVFRLRNEFGVAVVSIVIENLTTGSVLNWAGSLADDQWIYIDSTRWIVELDGTTPDMDDVSGDFPILLPAQNNSIKVTGISAGKFKPVYRARYL